MSEPQPAKQTSFPQKSYQPPPDSCQVILVRHGQSAPFVIGEEFPMLGGHGDPPLTELGHWQAAQVGERLKVEPITAIYTSSLTRTKQTAAPLAEHLGLRATEVHDLREVFMGEGEGGIFRQWMAEGHPIIDKLYESQDWAVVPGAESGAELSQRCSAALAPIAANHTNETIAVFVHGGVIGALLAHVWGTKAMTHLGSRHTAISHLVITGPQWVVRSFNDASHMGTITADTQL